MLPIRQFSKNTNHDDHIRKSTMCVCLRTRSNRSCLHHAVMQGHVDMVKFLLDSDPTGGKLLQLVTNNHDNALHSAIWGEQVEIASLLIERGIGMEICRVLISVMAEIKIMTTHLFQMSV